MQITDELRKIWETDFCLHLADLLAVQQSSFRLRERLTNGELHNNIIA